MSVAAWMESMTLSQWVEVIRATIRDGDVEATTSVLAAMAVHGFANEARELRLLLIALIDEAQGADS